MWIWKVILSSYETDKCSDQIIFTVSTLWELMLKELMLYYIILNIKILKRKKKEKNVLDLWFNDFNIFVKLKDCEEVFWEGWGARSVCERVG